MQANTPSLSIDAILASGHGTTITRNLAFPLRTTVHVFCEGPVIEDPLRLLQRGDFRNASDLTYVDHDDHEAEAPSIADASDDEDVIPTGGKYKTYFWSILRKLRIQIRLLARSN